MANQSHWWVKDPLGVCGYCGGPLFRRKRLWKHPVARGNYSRKACDEAECRRKREREADRPRQQRFRDRVAAMVERPAVYVGVCSACEKRPIGAGLRKLCRVCFNRG